jgi:AbiJ N-terminal domain 4
MPKFSRRYGYTQIERAFQRERIDDTLRTTLWNVLSISMWDRWEPYNYGYTAESHRINSITRRLWFHYFKRDMVPASKNTETITGDPSANCSTLIFNIPNSSGGAFLSLLSKRFAVSGFAPRTSPIKAGPMRSSVMIFFMI